MMSAARHKQVMQGQTGIARKVFEAVPIENPYNPSQIRTEMFRLGMTAPDMGILEGCLKALVEAGVCREHYGRVFTRAPSKPEPERPALHAVAAPPPQENPLPITPLPVPAERSPIDILAPIADQLRNAAEQAKEMSRSLKAVAESIDNAAAELEERSTVTASEINDLRQLKALLKNLGG